MWPLVQDPPVVCPGLAVGVNGHSRYDSGYPASWFLRQGWNLMLRKTFSDPQTWFMVRGTRTPATSVSATLVWVVPMPLGSEGEAFERANPRLQFPASQMTISQGVAGRDSWLSRSSGFLILKDLKLLRESGESSDFLVFSGIPNDG